jgi:hypothetical protein
MRRGFQRMFPARPGSRVLLLFPGVSAPTGSEHVSVCEMHVEHRYNLRYLVVAIRVTVNLMRR